MKMTPNIWPSEKLWRKKIIISNEMVPFILEAQHWKLLHFYKTKWAKKQSIFAKYYSVLLSTNTFYTYNTVFCTIFFHICTVFVVRVNVPWKFSLYSTSILSKRACQWKNRFCSYIYRCNFLNKLFLLK